MGFDRRRVVRQHNPVLTTAHPTGVLTVGNGDLAMSVDLSGLQTFPAFHELRPDPRRVMSEGLDDLPEQAHRPFDADNYQIPLRTQSTWGWYSTRRSDYLRLADAETVYATSRGPVPYLDRMGLQRASDDIPEELRSGAWFHYNPRRAHLGRLALVAPGADGEPCEIERLEGARTELDLWTGVVTASYSIDGAPVTVTTVADPGADRLATRVDSPLLAQGWAVAWVFDAQPDPLAGFEPALDVATAIDQVAPDRWIAERRVEATRYLAEVSTSGMLTARGGGTMIAAVAEIGTAVEVVVGLASGVKRRHLPGDATFDQVSAASAAWWVSYWMRGAAVTFEGSSDARAAELERRVVLSQYLTVVNGAGATPPAETGLTYNTWSGKFHLEMHWWHGAHYPMWGRGDLLERSLGWYHDTLDEARATAADQGYRGARWPKQTDLTGQESPSNIGVFLVWQQPHIIHLLELLASEGRDADFLARHYPLVEATAEFMVDFVEEREGRYSLPAPLIPAQESYLATRATNTDPTFELAYWEWALGVASSWRERLGMTPREEWRRVAEGMARPRLMPDGTYAALATAPGLIRKDHPSMLMACGWLPDTSGIDLGRMADTLAAVWREWDLQTTWGWDFPVMAMTASRLGDLTLALDALTLDTPKNVFLPNGHNPQMPGFLSLYLPANGGLLAAIAHMVAAVESGAALPPGWSLTAEGFAALPRPHSHPAIAS